MLMDIQIETMESILNILKVINAAIMLWEYFI